MKFPQLIVVKVADRDKEEARRTAVELNLPLSEIVRRALRVGLPIIRQTNVVGAYLTEAGATR